MTSHANKRLIELAEGNTARMHVLKAREDRSKSRPRNFACVACDEREWSNRAATDICEQCLIDLWSTQDVNERAQKGRKREGLMPVRSAERPWDLPYPLLADGGNERAPKGASFARPDSYGRNTEDAHRTLQVLMNEIVRGLAKVLPCDPASRTSAECFLAPGGFDSAIFLTMPKEVHKALSDLWSLFCWHSQVTHALGYKAGQNLIVQMASGESTHEQVLDVAAEVAQRTQGQIDRIKKGDRGHR